MASVEPKAASQKPLGALRQNLNWVIVGQESLVSLVLMALVARGHVLLEDVPGTGKTVLVKALARSLVGDFRRIQCTADLLPSDVSGVSIYNQASGAFQFQPGPVFANLVLADEINRASPRTQSALLEAMAEQQVTADGVVHALPRPHFIIATQNRLDMQGTYPLPKAQLDRFWLLLNMQPLSGAGLGRVLVEREHREPLEHLRQVVSCQEIVDLQDACLDIHISDAVVTYLVGLSEHLERHADVVVPPSTRAMLHLQRLAQACALLDGRDHVLPDDVKSLLVPALSHRYAVRPSGPSAREILEQTLTEVAVPIR